MASFFRKLWGVQPKQQTAEVFQTRPEVPGFRPISQLSVVKHASCQRKLVPGNSGSAAGHGASLSNEGACTTAIKRKADLDIVNTNVKKRKLQLPTDQTDPSFTATISSAASIAPKRKRKNSDIYRETLTVKRARLRAAEENQPVGSIKPSSPRLSPSQPLTSILDEPQ
jgi:hypothetical protein